MNKTARLLALLVSCHVGVRSTPLDPTVIDLDLYPHYVTFMRALTAHHLSANATLDRLTWANGMAGGLVGTCRIRESRISPSIYSYRAVEINRDANPDTISRLVTHELAHCLLGLCHSDDPNDIMYPEVNGPMRAGDLEALLTFYAGGGRYKNCSSN